MSRREGDRSTQPLADALCCRYLVARFASLGAIGDDATAASTALTWAVATHADGHHALLGAWYVQRDGDVAWLEVLAELWERGAERIEWAVLSSGAAPTAIASSEITRVVHWHDASAPEVALPPRMKRALAKSEDVAQRLHAAMQRAARRQGGRFDSADAAIACLQRQWQRLEHRLDAEHAARASRRSAGTAAPGVAPGR